MLLALSKCSIKLNHFSEQGVFFKHVLTKSRAVSSRATTKRRKQQVVATQRRGLGKKSAKA